MGEQSEEGDQGRMSGGEGVVKEAAKPCGLGPVTAHPAGGPPGATPRRSQITETNNPGTLFSPHVNVQILDSRYDLGPR